MPSSIVRCRIKGMRIVVQRGYRCNAMRHEWIQSREKNSPDVNAIGKAMQCHTVRFSEKFLSNVFDDASKSFVKIVVVLYRQGKKRKYVYLVPGVSPWCSNAAPWKRYRKGPPYERAIGRQAFKSRLPKCLQYCPWFRLGNMLVVLYSPEKKRKCWFESGCRHNATMSQEIEDERNPPKVKP